MKQLQHNGVLIPIPHKGCGLTLEAKGEIVKLTPEQEEMAVAWAKKVGTAYVQDRVFATNFHRDLSKKLGIRVRPGEVDFNEAISFVEEDRRWKATLSREQRKQAASQRKAQREANKERYGYARVDGYQVEIANYAVEPSSIFMGRGKHPLRGRWKEGPSEKEIELNLSPDAPRPQGNWKRVLWESDAMWIARWRDKLTGKIKYVTFSESSIMKQRKDIEKFDKAIELQQNLEHVQKHIWEGVGAADTRRRKIATVCFLIDKLKIRVGDEKDPDEADTVGAATLRSEHININGDGTVTFNFLGKDSIPHIFTVALPNNVTNNIRDFSASAMSTLFDGVRSKHVSEFLDEVMPGLSAKVFRTCYASTAVKTKLEKTHVKREDAEYWKKYYATMANLEAARICNHRRAIPKTWKSSLDKKKDRLKAVLIRAKENQAKMQLKIREQKERYVKRLRRQQERLETMEEPLEAYREQLAYRRQQGKSIQTTRKRIKLQRRAVAGQKERLMRLKSKHREQMEKLRHGLRTRKERDKAAIDKLKLRVETQKKTRDYNLVTSLKSYIDPRIYYEWGRQVDYDWKAYYPKALQRKFSWVEGDAKISPLLEKTCAQLG